MENQYKATYQKYRLIFKKPAKTSRDVLIEKDTWFLLIEDKLNGKSGIGECATIKGLSIDNHDLYEQKLNKICREISINGIQEIKTELSAFPSIQFGLETALSDLTFGGKKCIFDTDFFHGKLSIPINGLVWMSEIKDMQNQVKDKIDKGFECIKIKIGALNFEDELQFLKTIRREYGKEIILRLDANGAFKPEIALEKLKRLSEYQVHSIEQPIKAGNWYEMAKICSLSPIPIALDEELIGVSGKEKMNALLNTIQPDFLILKPSLLGGFAKCDEWITLSKSLNIAWWCTSALESNIGLNAIAQWVSQYPTDIYQGLGTGQLFENNFDSPLSIEKGSLLYKPSQNWHLEALESF